MIKLKILDKTGWLILILSLFLLIGSGVINIFTFPHITIFSTTALTVGGVLTLVFLFYYQNRKEKLGKEQQNTQLPPAPP